MDSAEYYNSEEEDYSDEVVELEGGDGDNHINKHYTILTEEAIRQLQNKDISKVSSVLSVSKGLACTLLRRNYWRINSVFEEWFADEETVREEIGVLMQNIPPQQPECLCKICFETIKIEDTLSAPCGHPFCVNCWKAYVTVSINDGPGCLTMRCPEPKCKANAGIDMVELVAAADYKGKYYRYLLRSYVEENKNLIKWCPAPGCELAAKLESGERENYDVACDCCYRFCWNCTEESHRPVDCKTVLEWIKQSTSDADNNKWILAFTKPCPSCNRNIEKNQGCNHMTCTKPCNFQFCWLCLTPWKSSHYCNKYQEEESVEAARKYLKRYAHYYERWVSNHKSRDIARSSLNYAREELIKKLANVEGIPESQVKFVIEAWEQIVECRSVLKWTYAYGYYLSFTKTGKTKTTFFEYLQGEAEGVLEKLHYCAEKEVEKYAKAKSPSDDFGEYKKKLISLTSITQNYFENLVRALENDLCEVSSEEGRQPKAKRVRIC